MKQINRLSEYFYQKSNLVNCITATAIMVLYASIVLGSKSECFQNQLQEGSQVLGLKFGYTFEYVSIFFNQLDESGLACYASFVLIWDNIFPILYTVMYILWISWIYKSARNAYPQLSLINLFPIIPCIFDWLENILELRLVNLFIAGNDIHNFDVTIASLVNQLKWMNSSAEYFVIFIGLSLIILRTNFFTKIFKGNE